MEFLSPSRRRSSARNVPSGEEWGETDVFAGYVAVRLLCVAGLWAGKVADAMSWCYELWERHLGHLQLFPSLTLYNAQTPGEIVMVVLVCGIGVVHVLLKTSMCSFQIVAWKARHHAASSAGSERIGIIPSLLATQHGQGKRVWFTRTKPRSGRVNDGK